MEVALRSVQAQALEDIAAAVDSRALDAVRTSYLGKKGHLTTASSAMAELSKDERPRVGKLINETRQAITDALSARSLELQAAADSALADEIDVTLPGDPFPAGGLHPVTLLMDRVIAILRRMGFALESGPDVEDEWHCFDALNTPADHPARNEADTFYLPDGRLLRTHTSTVQVRTMTRQAPPLRICSPGAAYRRDEIDATHLAPFHQVEGLVVDRDVSLADLAGTLTRLFQELLGEDTEVRFRPHFFPFTEPSLEVDVKARVLGGRWLEMGGCGMVDPAVFEAVNARRGDPAFDPEIVTGFAFGIGLERLAMILYHVPDLRMFYAGDLRFLSQFDR